MEEKENFKNYLIKLQPSANKKEKKSAYDELKTYLNNSILNEEDISFVYEGNEDLLGICELSGKKNNFGKFKDSSFRILEIIYFMLYESNYQSEYRKSFYLLDIDYFKKMNLDDHYNEDLSKSKEKGQNNTLKIIKIIHDQRSSIFKDYIRDKKTGENIIKLLQESTNDDEKLIKRFTYLKKIVEMNTGVLNLEPKCWDDVAKIKKKILTTEFLNTATSKKNYENIILDDEKELSNELIRNFVNPLTRSNEKLNYSHFSQEDKLKLHVQLDSFDPVFFLEKFYSECNLMQFSAFLKILEQNLLYINSDDENLIDKNIYKYLDCKKLLDTILEKFQGETKNLLNIFKDRLSSLQNEISLSISPVKKSFEMIIKSKNSKEIIHKFEKYFLMKDEIENFLKFSSFEDLADYLKKSDEIIQDISHSTYIYGEFYEYFSQTIENIKSLLITIIKNSMIPNVIVKHFKILLHFDVESETIDLLLHTIKLKVCDRISKYLAYTENFEIKNVKDFFSEEYNTVNMSEEYFSDILANSDNYINGTTVTDAKLDDDITSRKSLTPRKKELMNVENVIISLFNEIKEFLFMIKVIEETIHIKLKNLKTKRELEFLTIVKEIYFTLFHKLGEFLFSVNNNLDSMKENYIKNCKKLGKRYAEKEEKNELFLFYSEIEKCTVFNDNFNKNTFQNLSNILIDILDLFEIYLPSEEVAILNELKSSMVEKNYLAFLNEKFLMNLNYINEENTINFFDTNLSVFNQTFFSFTKSFIRMFYKSYKNIIEFYINISRKTKDVILNNELIILTYFFTLKNFYLKFIDFYKIEEDINYDDLKKNNCLILEILKNYSFLSSEVILITKSLFKTRYVDISDKMNDIESFAQKLIDYFTDIYVKNTSKILFKTLFSENKNNFYEKYNSFLMESNVFSDIRSNNVDAIFILSDSFKDLYEISKLEKSILTIQNIINDFIDIVTDHLLQIKPNLLKNFTFTTQILIELQVLFLIVNDFMSELNLSKKKVVLYLLYNVICEIRNVSNFTEEYIDEIAVFKDDEIIRKKKLINDSLDKYSSYIKCFKEVGRLKVK